MGHARGHLIKTMSVDKKELTNYLQSVQRCKSPVFCKLCRLEILPRDFKAHLSAAHDDVYLEQQIEEEEEVTIGCEWCLGQFRIPTGQRCQKASHLKECFNAYRNVHRVAPSIVKRKRKRRTLDVRESISELKESTAELRTLVIELDKKISKDDNRATSAATTAFNTSDWTFDFELIARPRLRKKEYQTII